jgi:AP-3 complex subunit mu
MYFLNVASAEVPPLLVIEFLDRVASIFVEYFEKLNENSIRENFVTVYQVLYFLLFVLIVSYSMK